MYACIYIIHIWINERYCGPARRLSVWLFVLHNMSRVLYACVCMRVAYISFIYMHTCVSTHILSLSLFLLLALSHTHAHTHNHTYTHTRAHPHKMIHMILNECNVSFLKLNPFSVYLYTCQNTQTAYLCR